MKTHQDFYDEAARGYTATDPLGVARYRRALTLADIDGGERVLDVGCKRCQLLSLLAERGIAVDYTGVDIAEENVRSARTQWPEARFEVADVSVRTPFDDGAFDRVFALEVMEHVPAPAAMLADLRRVLAPDGRLLLSVPNPYYYGEILAEIRGKPDTEGHIYAWADNNLRRLLAFTGFEVRARIGTYWQLPNLLRLGARSRGPVLLERVPALFARSRIYDCRPTRPASAG